MFSSAEGATIQLESYSAGTFEDGYQTGETWSDPVDIEGCAIAPGNTAEQFEANRQGVTVEFTVYAPPGTAFNPHDRVRLPGYPQPFDVVGLGKSWGNPFTGTESGVEVLVGRFDG